MNEKRAQYWAKIISEQESSGQTVRTFCRECQLGEHSFYIWRARLYGSARKPGQAKKKAEPVRFALVESGEKSRDLTDSLTGSLELLLPGGERLRIERGADAETLRMVVEALRR